MMQRPQGSAVFLAGLSVVATGCSAPTPEGSPTGEWGSASVVEELAIGVELGDDEYMLGAVRDIAVGADGTLYVSDWQQDVVRMYDTEGRFLRQIGRRGQGPGEYASAPGLGVLPDGTLVMRDGNTSRLSFFSPEGGYLDSFPAVPGFEFVVDQSGNILAQRFEGQVELVKYSREGEELDRVTFPAVDRAGAETFILGYGEGDIYPFPTETQSAWSPLGYLVTGRNDVYDIEVHDSEGTLHVRRDIARPEVDPEEQAEWETFRKGLEELWRARPDTRDIEFEPIPDVKPYFRRIHVGEDGRIWVFRYVAAPHAHAR